MNNLLFRKLSIDILYFFLTASLSITLIIWVIQAVNYLDFVTEDGHSLKVYFAYSILSLPKIFSRILIFVFFISCFYIINKYEENNEILVFWTNGIKKIKVINFLLKFSIIFIILQLFLSLYLVPFSQNLSRIYLKNSNIDFLPTLITEKKFINIFKGLTIFVDGYDAAGNISRIYINEKIQQSSKIIIAKTGKIQKKGDQFTLKLYDGSIINSEENKFYNINFKETEYDLSKFNSKTVTQQKIQQISSKYLFICIYNFYLKNKINNNVCKNRKIESISEEIYKRTVVPFFILILSLISSSLLIKPKSNKYIKYYKSCIFLIGFFFIISCQIGFKFFSMSLLNDSIVYASPILIVFIFYFLILLKTKFNLKYL
tara:strand:+ start:1303 stop:2421 length:1119 start_codon:yes stop_codon:yes gene_type:complete